MSALLDSSCNNLNNVNDLEVYLGDRRHPLHFVDCGKLSLGSLVTVTPGNAYYHKVAK